MSRIGLDRHGSIQDKAGDPLEGLVNLFDVGMILAVAFLIAGLTFSLSPKDSQSGTGSSAGKGTERVIPNPSGKPTAKGNGIAVGQVYRLPNGTLIYVKKGDEQR